MIHGQIKNCGTVTRRPSGSSPNLLQISKKDGSEGIRSCILPRYPDHVIISPDFSGQELRIMASESGDPTMLDAYIGPVKKDIHSVTAAGLAPVVLERKFPGVFRMFTYGQLGMDYGEFMAGRKADNEQVSKALNFVRNKVAKAVNFLIIYGGGPTTLARNLGVPVDTAKAFMNQVFLTYPRILPWQAESIEFARTHGYVQDAWGNRRHAPAGLWSRDGNVRSRAERQLVNAPIQAGAASLLKVVMRQCRDTHLFEDTGAILLMPVYDELACSVPASTALEFSRRLVGIMNMTPPGHIVPMVAELSIGRNNWASMVELGASPTDEEILAVVNGGALEEAA
jgi:DNA polymerase-1